MCGRFVQTRDAEDYGAYFSVDVVKTDLALRSWNVAPTKQVYAVAEHDGERMLGTFEWGLVPAWAKDRGIGARLINARVETLSEKPSFRDSFRKRRCIIPADGFYEWQGRPGGKVPHYIHAPDGRPLALAGLWSSWKDPGSGEVVRTCTIITGEPSEVVAPIHDRMPVVLPPSAWDVWLDPDAQDTEEIRDIVERLPKPALSEHPVSTLVNRVANDGPELITPPDAAAG